MEQSNSVTSALDFSSYINEKTHNFIGREWVLARIASWLATPNSPRYFIITGEPGIGKTAIAARLTQSPEVTAAHFCIARQADTLDPLNFTRSISRQLTHLDGFTQHILKDSGTQVSGVSNVQMNYGQSIGVYINNLIVTSPTASMAFNRTVVAPLKQQYEDSTQRQLVILVDGLDEAVQYQGSETIVDLLANTRGLPPQVRFVLTSRPESEALRHFEHIPHLLLSAESDENLQDVRAYICDQVETSTSLQERLVVHGVGVRTFIDQVVTASQGNFLYLIWLLPAIADGSMWFDTLDALPKGLDGIYREFLRTRIVGNISSWRTHYRLLLGILAIAQTPLTTDQLGQFTGQQSKQEVYDYLLDIQQFLDPIQAELGKYQLYHQSVTDFLSRREAAQEFWIDLAFMHRYIATYYRQNHVQNWYTCDLYGLRYLPTHLSEAYMVEELEQTVTDLAFLDAKVHVFSVYSVLTDIALLKAYRKEVHILEKGIRSQAHIFSSHPELFLPQLYSYIYGRYPEDREWWVRHFETPLKDSPYLPTIWLKRLNHCPDREDESLVMTINGHSGAVSSAFFSHDGKYIISNGADGTTKVWDVYTGEKIEQFGGMQADEVRSVAALAYGDTIILGGLDGLIRFYDMKTRHLMKGFKIDHKIISLAYDPVGNRLVSGDADGIVKLWDVKSGKEIKSFSGHQDTVNKLLFSPDGSKIAARSQDDSTIFNGDTIFIWEVNSSEIAAELWGHDASDDMVFTPDGKQLLWIDTEEDIQFNSTIKFYDLVKRREGTKSFYDSFRADSLDVSPDGKRIITAGNDYAIKLWNIEEIEDWMSRLSILDRDIQSSESVKRFGGHFEEITSVSFSPDGKKIVSGDEDGIIKLWDVEAHRKNQTGWRIGGARSAMFSSDGKKVIVVSQKKERTYWDVETGEESNTKRPLRGKRIRTGTRSFPISPPDNDTPTANLSNGKWEVSTSAATIYLQDMKVGKKVAVFFGEAPILYVSFSPDGQEIWAVDRHNEPIIYRFLIMSNKNS